MYSRVHYDSLPIRPARGNLRRHRVSLKPIDACEPSQNGLFCDAPQRHKVMRLRTSYIESVGTDQLHSTAQPQRAGATFGRVFDQADRRLVLRFNWFAGRVVPGHKPP